MATIHYANDGHNGNSGSLDNPVLTRDYALGLAKAGDTVLAKSAHRFYGNLHHNKSGVTFGTYGGSDPAIFSGFLPLNAWVNKGNGIWEMTSPHFQSTLKVVRIDGEDIRKARWPRHTAANKGYLTISGASDNSVSNSAISTLPNLVGSEVVIRVLNYSIDTATITAKSGNTITFTGTHRAPSNGWGFFFQNHPSFLTEFGDWIFDSATRKISMYFGTENPNFYDIEASATDNLVTNANGIADVVMENLRLEGANKMGMLLNGGNGFQIRDLEIGFCGEDGITALNHPAMSMERIKVGYCHNAGVFLQGGTQEAQLLDSHIHHIGLFNGMGRNRQGSGTGVQIPWFNSLIQYNLVEFVGYCGVRFEKAGTKCLDNEVRRFCEEQEDGGGVYTWNAGGNDEIQHGMECGRNIIHDALGAKEGTPYATSFQSDGVYLDDNAGGVKVFENTVWNVTGRGYMLHNAEAIEMVGNRAFDCNMLFQISADVTNPASNERMVNLIIKENEFIARTESQTPMFIFATLNDIERFVSNPDNWNNNVIGRPIKDTETIRIQRGQATTYYTLDGWPAAYGYDRDSVKPRSITDLSAFRLEANPSKLAKTITLDGTYEDMRGLVQPRTITIAPYGSALLIKTSNELPGDPDPEEPEEPTDPTDPEEPTDPEPKPIPFKSIYKNGFVYNAAEMSSDVPSPRLQDDLIGGTADMPKHPVPIDLSKHAFFDTTVKRLPTDAGSVKFVAKLEHLWHNSAKDYWTNRQQHSIYHPYLRKTKMWFSFSIFLPEYYLSDSHEEVFYNFGGVGGGAMSFRIQKGHFTVSMSRGDQTTSTNRIILVMEAAIGGVWHDFVGYAEFSPLTDKGRLTVWKDGKLARLHNPVTRQPWKVPVLKTSGIQDQYTAYPAKGSLQTHVVDDGQEIDVLDWSGFTLGFDEDVELDHRWRTGIYKSGWNTNYDIQTGEIKPETYVAGNPLYIPPSQRIREIWYANVNWQPVESPMGALSPDIIFRSLDAEGDLPAQYPSWWEEVAPPDPEDPTDPTDPEEPTDPDPEEPGDPPHPGLPLKKVLVDGISYSSGQDQSTKLPLPADVMSYVQSPSGMPDTDFVWWDSSVKPGTRHNGMLMFEGNCLYPTHTATVTTMRLETASSNPLIRQADELFYAFSVHTPVGYVNDALYEVLHQWHGWPGSPNISLRRENGRLFWQVYTASGFANQMVFDVGAIPAPGESTHFIVYLKFRDNLTGRLTVWRDGKLARLHHRNGNKWVVPRSSTPGVGANYIIKPALGDLPHTVMDGDGEVSILDWYGYTAHPGSYPNPEKYPKFGIYKSSITNRYTTGQNELKAGWDVPGHELYLPPEARICRVGIGAIGFETRLEEYSHTEIYRSLHVNAAYPLEFPEWWIFDEEEPEDPEEPTDPDPEEPTDPDPEDPTDPDPEDPEEPEEPTDPDPEEPEEPEEPTDPTDPGQPEEVNISLSVRIPGRVYRTLLAAVNTYKPPNGDGGD